MKDTFFSDLHIVKSAALGEAYDLIISDQKGDFFTLLNKAMVDTQKSKEILNEPLFPGALHHDAMKFTLLLLLAYHNRHHIIKELKAQCHISDADYQKMLDYDDGEAFYSACTQGHIETATLLFSQCSEERRQKLLRLHSKPGHRSLFAVTAMNGHFEVLKLVLEWCAPQKKQYLIKADGYIALSCACAYENGAMFDLLWELCEVKSRYTMLSSGSHRAIKWALDCCNSNSRRPSPKRIRGQGWVNVSTRFPSHEMAQKIVLLYPPEKLIDLLLEIHRGVELFKEILGNDEFVYQVISHGIPTLNIPQELSWRLRAEKRSLSDRYEHVYWKLVKEYSGSSLEKCITHFPKKISITYDTSRADKADFLFILAIFLANSIEELIFKNIISLSLYPPIQRSHTLESLTIGYQPERNLHLLCEALTSNQSIKALNLSGGEINSADMKHLADMLRVNARLTSLNLSNNKLTDKGVIELLGVLDVNHSLREIDLRGNETSSESSVYLRELLRKGRILMPSCYIRSSYHDEIEVRRLYKENHEILEKVKKFIASALTFMMCSNQKSFQDKLPSIPPEIWRHLFYEFAAYLLDDDPPVTQLVLESIKLGASMFRVTPPHRLLESEKCKPGLALLSS